MLAGADAEFLFLVELGYTPFREDILEFKSEIVRVHLESKVV